MYMYLESLWDVGESDILVLVREVAHLKLIWLIDVIDAGFGFALLKATTTSTLDLLTVPLLIIRILTEEVKVR